MEGLVSIEQAQELRRAGLRRALQEGDFFVMCYPDLTINKMYPEVRLCRKGLFEGGTEHLWLPNIGQMLQAADDLGDYAIDVYTFWTCDTDGKPVKRYAAALEKWDGSSSAPVLVIQAGLNELVTTKLEAVYKVLLELLLIVSGKKVVL